jgi:hypothetical protein
MFPLQYPNVGLSEIVGFNDILKNEANFENVLKINKCIYKDETYNVIKYDKTKLTLELIPTFGLFRSVILSSKKQVLSVSPPKSMPYEEFIKKYPEFPYENSELKQKAKEPKKIDKMKIANMQKNIEHNKQFIFEFLIFDFAKNIIETLPKLKHGFYLYSLVQFQKSSIDYKSYLKNFN